MGEMRVAVIEDDPWKRAALAEQLDASPKIEVVHALDQDEAASWSPGRWDSIDAALIDVYDDRAPGEVGTDLYSGIAAVEQMARVKVRVVAILPHTPHPLVQLRLAHARPDWVYSRWELQSVENMVDALLWSPPSRRPTSPPPQALEGLGVRAPLPNEAVRAYLASRLNGLLQPGLKLKDLGIDREVVDAFRAQIGATGFVGTAVRNRAAGTIRAPWWPDVRDYLLRLLGRLDAPPSEHDRTWVLPSR